MNNMAYTFGSFDPITFSNFITNWQNHATQPAWNSQQTMSHNNPISSAAAVAPTNNTPRVNAGSYNMGSGYTMSVNNDGTYSVGSSAIAPTTTPTTTTTATPTTTTTATPTTTTTATPVTAQTPTAVASGGSPISGAPIVSPITGTTTTPTAVASGGSPISAHPLMTQFAATTTPTAVASGGSPISGAPIVSPISPAGLNQMTEQTLQQGQNLIKPVGQFSTIGQLNGLGSLTLSQ